MLGRYNVGVVQIVRRRIQALMLPEDTLKHYFNYRETPAPNTKHQSPITKRFEFDSGADFFEALGPFQNYRFIVSTSPDSTIA